MSLLAHYRMNDTAAGTAVADASGNGNTGTSVRNTSLLTAVGKLGAAFNFNGGTDRITVPVTQAAGSWTFCIWANSDTDPSGDTRWLFESVGAGDTPRCTCCWNAWGNTFAYNDQGSWRYFGATPVAGAWHHVAFSCNSVTGKVQCFLDGVQSGTDQTYTSIAIGGSVKIGGLYWSNPAYTFDGLLDDARLYGEALTVAQIKAIYNAGMGSDRPYPWNPTIVRPTIQPLLLRVA